MYQSRWYKYEEDSLKVNIPWRQGVHIPAVSSRKLGKQTVPTKKNNSKFFASFCHHVTSFASDEKPISGISNENRLENDDYFEATWRKSAPTYTHKHCIDERRYFFISFKNLSTSLTYSYTQNVFQTLSLQITKYWLDIIIKLRMFIHLWGI